MSRVPIVKLEPLRMPWETQDPFIITAYHRDEFPKGNEKMGLNVDRLRGRNIGNDFVPKDGFRMYYGRVVPGFPVHPHRGFETVTIVKEGVVDHSDSYGGAGRYMAGDVQWLTAGKGIQHSEMFPLLHQHKDNPFELFQIWLNLPSKNKFVEPHYKMLWKESIPVVELKDENGKVTKIDVVAGTLNGTKAPIPNPDSWAADPMNEVAIYTVKMEAGANWILPKASERVNRSLFFYKGNFISINGKSINEHSNITLAPEIETTVSNGNTDAFFLLLQGKPIGESVVPYGPFVMNSEQEIRNAISDYQRTQFGGWPWPMDGQVWERSKGRFAKYDDGREELK